MLLFVAIIMETYSSNTVDFGDFGDSVAIDIFIAKTSSSSCVDFGDVVVVDIDNCSANSSSC